MNSKLSTISVAPVKTDIFKVSENIFEFLTTNLQRADLEGKVLAITSKIISLAENRLVAKNSVEKKTLVQKEADHYLTEGLFGVELTLTHGLLIPSAGIDESNSPHGDYILYPKSPYKSVEAIYQFLKRHFQLQNFGVILTDSRSSPLRRGVTGVALAHWGFQAVHSLVGNNDIFDKPLKFTHVNVADSLAAMATFAMGEGAEITPLAIITGAQVQFTETSAKEEFQILPEDDLYFPLLKPWLKN